MKHFILFFSVIITLVFSSFYSAAQVGWKWGVGSYSSSSAGNYEAISIAVDKSGNVFELGTGEWISSITIGATTLYSSTGGKMIITKADSSGHFLWSIGNDSGSTTSIGIVTDSIGNLYVLGSHDSGKCKIGSCVLISSQPTYFLAKVSPSGTVLWAQDICLIASISLGSGWGFLGVDGQSNVYISGCLFQRSISIGTTTLYNKDTSGVTSDIFIAKYDPLGHVVWAKNFGGNNNEGINTMAVTKDGSIFISALSNSDSIMIGSTTLFDSIMYYGFVNILTKFDCNGNPIWAENLDIHIGVESMITDAFGNIYLAGTLDSTIILGTSTLIDSSTLGADFLIAKYDSSGKTIWGNSASGLYLEAGRNNISIDTCGNIWVCGSMRDTMNFNGNLLLAPPSSLEPTFMAEYDKSGTYITSTIFPAGGDDVSDIATDNRGNFYVGGDYSFHSIVIGPDTLRYTSSEQLYIAKYKYDITDCGGIIGPLQSVPISASPILLYPNPSKSELTITSPEKINQISISNLLGQTVFTHEYNADEVQVDVTNLPAGMYLFKINNAVVRKFRKQ